MSDEAMRYNSGKLRLGLVPASIWFTRWGDTQDEDLREMLVAMCQFQEGDDYALMRFDGHAVDEIVPVSMEDK